MESDEHVGIRHLYRRVVGGKNLPSLLVLPWFFVDKAIYAERGRNMWNASGKCVREGYATEFIGDSVPRRERVAMVKMAKWWKKETRNYCERKAAKIRVAR